MKYTSKSQEETHKLGRGFAKRLKGGEVVCLYGNLGSGKTTFISGVVNYFKPKTRVLSPTFIIVRHYRFNKPPVKNLLHADLYRLEDKPSIEALGLADFLHQPDTLVFIEWAEKLGGYKPRKCLEVSFIIKESNEREITISGPDN